MTKIGLIQFLLLFLISSAYGQKVKYKDIYALLSTKQYEQAEPFLKQYLRVTPDNPNAYLFMGNILREKALKNDILKQTATAIANMDSAIINYDKANKMLDERQVRKNKEYYEAYNRRDLRTGEFGVKLSDIQFDLEKKIEGLQERIQKVKMAHHFFSLADRTYKASQRMYSGLQKNYPTLNQLYLRADEQTIKDLTVLSSRLDSCLKAFDHYRSASASIGNTGYNQKVTLAAVADFKRDGVEAPDFFADEVKLWDYKTFADNTRDVIEKEVLPMRKHLVTYDVEINKLRVKLNKDSISVRNDLTRLVDKLLYDQLKKFDEDPLPMAVFALKTTDLEYRSALLEHKPFRDSADLHLQIRLLQKELGLLRSLDSIASGLSDEKLAQKSLDYADFVNSTYGDASTLRSYIRSLKHFGMEESREKQSALDQYLESLKYIVDAADSVPLTMDIPGTYRPLVIVPEKYTTGVSARDTAQLQGYFYTITASRRPEVRAYFPLDTVLFKAKDIATTRALAYSDAAGQIFYVLLYSEQPVKDKFPTTLAKIYRSDGLAWKVEQPLAFAPVEMVVSPDSGELIIRNGSQEVVVDKNGGVK